jgi:hypothetical protein
MSAVAMSAVDAILLKSPSTQSTYFFSVMRAILE